MAPMLDGIRVESSDESASRGGCSDSPSSSSDGSRRASSPCRGSDSGEQPVPSTSRAAPLLPGTHLRKKAVIRSSSGGRGVGQVGGGTGRLGDHGGRQGGRGGGERVTKARRSPLVPYEQGGSPTWSTAESVTLLRDLCDFPAGVELRLPRTDESPWICGGVKLLMRLARFQERLYMLYVCNLQNCRKSIIENTWTCAEEEMVEVEVEVEVT